MFVGAERGVVGSEEGVERSADKAQVSNHRGATERSSSQTRCDSSAPVPKPLKRQLGVGGKPVGHLGVQPAVLLHLLFSNEGRGQAKRRRVAFEGGACCEIGLQIHRPTSPPPHCSL